jgi:hypothetical protein
MVRRQVEDGVQVKVGHTTQASWIGEEPDTSPGAENRTKDERDDEQPEPDDAQPHQSLDDPDGADQEPDGEQRDDQTHHDGVPFMVRVNVQSW